MLAKKRHELYLNTQDVRNIDRLKADLLHTGAIKPRLTRGLTIAEVLRYLVRKELERRNLDTP